MKKIAIDCRSLEWKHSGIARYLDNILKELSAIDKNNEYFLLFPRKTEINYNFAKSKKVYLFANEFVYKFLKTPFFLKKEKIDIYWSPTQELPFWKPKGIRYFVTVHDASITDNILDQNLKVKILYYIGLYNLSVIIADRIFTDSLYAKKDIMEKFKAKENKIIVTYLGCDICFKRLKKAKAYNFVKDKFKITSPFIFYVNNGRPLNLLKAYASLIDHEWKNIDIKLVVLGKSSYSVGEDVDVLINTLGINIKVMYIDYFISDIELNNLYSGAEFFVMPSYYEGFGLTPLEALQSGTSILLSNITCLPEIYSDAAIYCDPFNILSIKESMSLLLNDSALREKLVKNGEKIIKKFNWTDISELILYNLK